VLVCIGFLEIDEVDDGGTPLQRSLSRCADDAGKLIMESISEKIRYSLLYRIRDKTFSFQYQLTDTGDHGLPDAPQCDQGCRPIACT
jgi:hypothetical protein